ncbi:LacI family DNA-binding transcriptional regulator [Vibrio cholerae]
MTLKQLAQELGLSKSTVSRALNGYLDVNEVTRKRVLEYAKKTGYSPNPAAVRLASGCTRTVGVILPALGQELVSPAFSRILASAARELAVYQYNLQLTTLVDLNNEIALYEHYIKGGTVDGLFLVRPRVHDPRLELLIKHSFPFVVHGRSPGKMCSWVDTDSEQTFYKMTCRQLESGHQHIAFIDAPAELQLSVDRRQGFLKAISEYGIWPRPEWIRHGALDFETGYNLATELLKGELIPTSIICADDNMALGAIAASESRGLKVGVDIAITGYGNYQQGNYSKPALTTVSYDTDEVGVNIARMLLAQMGVKQIPQESKSGIVVPAHIVERGSDKFYIKN